MPTATEILDIDLNHWVPGTRLFRTSDDLYFVVSSDLEDHSHKSIKVIRRQTAVLYCNPDATVTDMIPDHTFPPGTTPEEAIALLGYTLEEQ